MREPGYDVSDVTLADHDDDHHETSGFGEPLPVRRAERLDVTVSVRFTPAEIADVRARARAAGMKPTAYICRRALDQGGAPLYRASLARALDTLSRDVEHLRQAAG